MDIRDFFGRQPTDAEAGISVDKRSLTPRSELPYLADVSLWYAFAEVSEEGVMKPQEKAAAHRRMTEFFQRHPNTEQSFEGLTQDEAKKKIDDMDTGSVARAA